MTKQRLDRADSPARLEQITVFFAALGSGIANKLVLLAIESFAAFVAGVQLGRLASDGHLASLLQREGITLRPIPGPSDGVRGLAPIGRFYLCRAAILALAVAFLAAWVVLILFWPRYSQ
jgi:hypothetical protein